MAGQHYGDINIAASNKETFNNAAIGDMLVYTETNQQRIHFGTTVGADAMLTVSNSNIQVGGSVVPTSNEQFDLGSANFRFRDLFLSGNTIDLGGTKIQNMDQNIVFKDSSNNLRTIVVDQLVIGDPLSSNVVSIKKTEAGTLDVVTASGLPSDIAASNVNADTISARVLIVTATTYASNIDASNITQGGVGVALTSHTHDINSLSNVLSIVKGGTGVTASTGTGSNVLNNSPVISDATLLNTTIASNINMKGTLNVSVPPTTIYTYPPIQLTANPETVSGQVYGNGVYQLSSSDNSPSSELVALFDSNNATYFTAGSYRNPDGVYLGAIQTTVSGTVYNGDWFQIQLPDQIYLTSYVLGAVDAAYSANTWIIAGSTNGTTWNLVDQKVLQGSQMINFQNTTFSTQSAASYSYYRIICQRTNGANTFGLATFRVAGTLGVSSKDIAVFGYNSTPTDFVNVVRIGTNGADLATSQPAMYVNAVIQCNTVTASNVQTNGITRIDASGNLSNITINASTITTGVLGSNYGGTGVTASTGSGSNVLNVSPTLSNAVITGSTVCDYMLASNLTVPTFTSSNASASNITSSRITASMANVNNLNINNIPIGSVDESDSSIISSASNLSILSSSNINPEWSAIVNGTGVDTGRNTTCDSFGNVYVTGSYISTTTVPLNNADGSTSAISLRASTLSGAYLIKYDNKGIVQWAVTVNGDGSVNGTAIAIDLLGNVYLGGDYASGTATIYSTNGTTFVYNSNSTTFGNYSAFAAKFNSAGVNQWAVRVDSTQGNTQDTVYDICVDTNFNVFFCGMFTGAGLVAFNPNNQSSGTTLPGASSVGSYAVKYNSNGLFQWGVVVDVLGGTESGNSVAVDTSGNLYFAGHYTTTSASIYNAGGSLNAATIRAPTGGQAAFLVKFDTSGVTQWFVSIDGSSNETGSKLAVDSAGSVFLTGTYASAAKIYNLSNSDSGLTLRAPTSTGAYLVKYDTNGSAQWFTSIDGSGNEDAKGLAIDSLGNVYVAGQYTVSQAVVYNTNNTQSAITLRATSGDTSAYIIKYNSNGSAQYAVLIDGVNSEASNAVAVDSDCNIFIAGTYTSTAGALVYTINSLGVTTPTHASLPGTSTSAGFLIKCSPSYYRLLSNLDSTRNGQVKQVFNNSTRDVKVDVCDAANTAVVKPMLIKKNTIKNLLWYGTTWRDSGDVGWSNIAVFGSITPSVDANFDLGSLTAKFRNGYIQSIMSSNVTTSNIQTAGITPSIDASIDIGSATAKFRNGYIQFMTTSNVTASNVQTAGVTRIDASGVLSNVSAPSNALNVSIHASKITGILGSSFGGTGVSISTGTGCNVLNIGPTLSNATLDGTTSARLVAVTASVYGYPTAGVNGGNGERIVLFPGDATRQPYAFGVGNGALWSSVPTGSTLRQFVGGNEVTYTNSNSLQVTGSISASVALQTAGIPRIDANGILSNISAPSNASNVNIDASRITSGVLGSNFGGTGVATSTGTGSNVLNTSPIMTGVTLLATTTANVMTTSNVQTNNLNLISQLLGSSNDTAQAPSFTWVNDSNTGVYHDSSNKIGIAIAGSNLSTIGLFEYPPSSMTSNMTVVSGMSYGNGTYVATQSVGIGGVGAYLLFDKSQSAYNSVIAGQFDASGFYSGGTDTNGYKGVYVQLKLPYKVVLARYYYAIDRARRGVMFGSNDGSTWTMIDSFYNLGFTATRNIDNKTPYQYYRLVISERTSVGIFFRELRLYGYETVANIGNMATNSVVAQQVIVSGSDVALAPTVILQETKASGVGAGSNDAGVWHSRMLSTTSGHNTSQILATQTLSSGRFMLMPGKYLVEASAPCYSVDAARAGVFNWTSSNFELYSPSTHSSNVSATTTVTGVMSNYHITSYGIRQWTQTANTNGLGLPTAITGVPEVYAEARIRKLEVYEAASFPPAALTSISNTLSGNLYGNGTYLAFASSSNTSNEQPYGAFTRNGTTFELANTFWTSSSNVYNLSTGVFDSNVSTASTTVGGTTYPGEWLQLRMPQSIVINGYNLKICQSKPTRAPVNFMLAGSSDAGSNWTLLDTRTNITSYPTTGNTYRLTNANPYSDYRLIVTAISSNNDIGATNIQDLSLLSGLPNM